ncbi:hypothetical protein FGIG_07187 [Fasciola gigantica]|uniref:Uncharacterized protein n=1 Tax=Fasciola gigantica TaxID=46835 RepID=A0A504Z0I1_FASGI|nr:hypothetical protein FGIG_07187 [Fasciola gigantica]
MPNSTTTRSEQFTTTTTSTIEATSQMTAGYVAVGQEMTPTKHTTADPLIPGITHPVSISSTISGGSFIPESTTSESGISERKTTPKSQLPKQRTNGDSITNSTLSTKAPSTGRREADRVDHQPLLIIVLAIVSLLLSSLLIWTHCCIRYGHAGSRNHTRWVDFIPRRSAVSDKDTQTRTPYQQQSQEQQPAELAPSSQVQKLVVDLCPKCGGYTDVDHVIQNRFW